MEYKEILQQAEYGFIKTNEHLGKHVILLGVAGSYSYGTNIETSDIDIRGITLNQKSDLIGFTQFEQYVDENTDTVIYAFNKIVTLLLNCNPNTIELLGLNPELETEIFVNANMTHYPFRDYSLMWNTMANVVRDYEKIGKRNRKKDALHLNKHAMYLIRLFMMALDILEKGGDQYLS